MESISLEISVETKMLYGASQWPDDVAQGKKKGTGKMVMGRIEFDLLNNILWADAKTSGVTFMNDAEAHTIPGTPFQITVTNSANFSEDFGVVATSTTGSVVNQQRFVNVPSAPAAGQYSVSAGVYTFNTADAGATVVINYSSTSAVGSTLTINNQVMGYGPVFELVINQSYASFQGQGATSSGGIPSGVKLYACRVSKISEPHKQDDYTKIEVDFDFFPNASGVIAQFYQANAA